jgi:DNA-binding NarL/FixJ family response regulator
MSTVVLPISSSPVQPSVSGRRLGVVLIEAQEVVREGLRSWLASDPRMDPVAGFAETDEAVAWMELHGADLVVLGASSDPEASIRAANRLRFPGRPPRLIWFGSSIDGALLRRVCQAGVCGFLLREVHRTDFLRAVEDVSKGRFAFSPEVTSALWRQTEVEPGSDTTIALRPREREILERISRGESNKEIAAALGLSFGTLRNQVSSVYSRIGATGRTSAVAFWLGRRASPEA